jgi:hypothetical protein
MGRLLRAARRAGDALRNATTQFAASADTERADDGAADSAGDESALAGQKSEYLKRFASLGF